MNSGQFAANSLYQNLIVPNINPLNSLIFILKISPSLMESLQKSNSSSEFALTLKLIVQENALNISLFEKIYITFMEETNYSSYNIKSMYTFLINTIQANEIIDDFLEVGLQFPSKKDNKLSLNSGLCQLSAKKVLESLGKSFIKDNSGLLSKNVITDVVKSSWIGNQYH